MITQRRITPTHTRAAARLVAATAAIGLAACGGGHTSDAPQRRPAIEVRTAEAVAGGAAGFDAGGVVQAKTTATLVARIMAPVREVRVAPGDRVRAGQPLVLLDDRDLSAAARQAQSAGSAAAEAARAALADRDAARAALTLARASHGRIASLHAKNSATAHELDEATAALQGAEARAAAAEARIAQTEAALASARAAGEAAGVTASFATITAPFSGIVTEKLVERGNMAAPGTPLLRLEDTSGFRLDVRLDESRARAIEVGDRVPVRVGDDATDRRATDATGEIAEIARAVDADSRAFLVKIALPEIEGLRSGTFGRARVPGAARSGPRVPAGAVVRRGQVRSVFVVDGDTARLRLVSAGEPEPDGQVEILAGLEPGERVVVDPPPSLSDGAPVRAAGTAARQGVAR